MEAVNADRRVLVRARIVHDDSPDSPRTWGHVGHIVTWDRFGATYEDDNGRTETLRDVNGIGGRRLVHEYMRGVSVGMRVDLPNGEHFRQGFIYVTREEMRDPKLGIETPDKARAYPESEAETYIQWADGDVYGRIIERRTLCELCASLDSDDVPDECPHCEVDDDDAVWGFYGLNVDANGMTDGLDDVAATALREEASEYRIEYGSERIRAEWHEAA